jgi:tetratricopeptide (TPR) repeat protein
MEMAMRTRVSALNPCLFFGLVFLLLLGTRSSPAQETSVQGVVTDEEGKPVRDARLTFTDAQRGLNFVLKTDKNGKFLKVGIPPTTYKVTVESEGFVTLEYEARIQFGMRERLEIKLEKPLSVPEEDENMTAGSDLFRAGKYDEAAARFRKVIERFPLQYEGHFNLGLTLFKKGEVDPAIVALEKAAEINPQSVDSLFSLGEAYFAKGESEKAQESFSKAISLNPESPLAHYNLGLAYYRLGRNEEALAAFEKSISLKPDNASAYYQAGLAAIRLQSFDKAIKSFQEFLRLEPNAPEAAQVKTMIEELKNRLNNNRTMLCAFSYV